MLFAVVVLVYKFMHTSLSIYIHACTTIHLSVHIICYVLALHKVGILLLLSLIVHT